MRKILLISLTFIAFLNAKAQTSNTNSIEKDPVFSTISYNVPAKLMAKINKAQTSLATSGDDFYQTRAMCILLSITQWTKTGILRVVPT